MKTMTVPTRYGTEVVSGIELKRFFVHRTLRLANGTDPKTWSITHKATGRRMPRDWYTRTQALLCARKLDDFEGFDALPVNPPLEGFKSADCAETVAFVHEVYASL